MRARPSTCTRLCATRRFSPSASSRCPGPWPSSTASNEGYVVTASSDVVVKVVINPATGSATVQLDPSQPPKTLRVLEIPVGKNPRGIVVSPDDTRAYVMNYVSRDVTVIDLTSVARERARHAAVRGRCRRQALWRTRSTSARSCTTPRWAHSIRRPDHAHRSPGACPTTAGAPAPPAIRRSLPRQRGVDLPGRAAANDSAAYGLRPERSRSRSIMRPLLWSANRDEQEDFTNNIRGVSGGLGLIVLADGITQDTNTPEFTPRANGGRNQAKGARRGRLGCDQGLRPVRDPRADLTGVEDRPGCDCRARRLFTSATASSATAARSGRAARVSFTPAAGPGAGRHRTDHR